MIARDSAAGVVNAGKSILGLVRGLRRVIASEATLPEVVALAVDQLAQVEAAAREVQEGVVEREGHS